MKTIKFAPQTGATRLFLSYNLAQEWFPNAHLIVRPSGFNDVVNHKGEPIPLHYQYNAMFNWRPRLLCLDENTYFNKDHEILVAPHSFHQLDESEQLDMLWRLAWSIGNLVTAPPYGSEVKHNPTAQAVLRQGFVIDLDAAEQAHDTDLPKQAKAIAAGLHKAQYDFYTESEMREFMLNLVAERVLKTKQDPWRILRYYRKDLTHHGVFTYQETTQ